LSRAAVLALLYYYSRCCSTSRKSVRIDIRLGLLICGWYAGFGPLLFSIPFWMKAHTVP
jgi:hypothetical protein